MSPILDLNLANFNFLTFQDQAPGIITAYEKGQIGIGGIDIVGLGDGINPEFADRSSTFTSHSESQNNVALDRQLRTSVFLPVFDTHNRYTRKPVAVILAVIDWAVYFENGFLPGSSEGMLVIIENECDGPFTYQIGQGELRFIGQGDLHYKKYDAYEVCIHPGWQPRVE
jgi:hypothetical protein